MDFCSVFLSPKKVIPSSRAADAPVVLISKAITNIAKGERIKVQGWAQVDALEDLIGTTLHIGYKDVTGEVGAVRWKAPSIHIWDGGNVWRARGEHHKVLFPVGHYVSPAVQRSVVFSLLLNVYSTSPTPLRAQVNDCAMMFERFPA